MVDNYDNDDNGKMVIKMTLMIFRPEMKSTFHHTLITLAVVDILFVFTLIIDTQVKYRFQGTFYYPMLVLYLCYNN